MCSPVPKASPGTATHVSLMKQTGGQLRWALDPRLPQISRNVGIDVEGAFGLGAGDAREISASLASMWSRRSINSARKLAHATPASRQGRRMAAF